MAYLTTQLSRRTFLFGFKLWVVLGIGVGAVILVLFLLSLWLLSKKKPARNQEDKVRLHNSGSSKIPSVSKEIQEVKVDGGRSPFRSTFDISGPDKIVVHVDAVEAAATPKSNRKFKESAAGYVRQTLSHYDTPDRVSSPGSFVHLARLPRTSPNAAVGPEAQQVAYVSTSGESRSVGSSPVPEAAHLGWGHWYTLRELEAATNSFADCNVLGEGGYGIVYKGRLPDGTSIAVKNLLNNRGQAEREFRVEVEAIGRVRHKNLVRLLGYCMEGNHRMLVYEYVDNGNLDQWLHGPISRTRTLSWESRMRIILGTAKALAYLHEALEPKVVHRDIKSSNILIDTTYHAKISDFGLAKLLGADKSHVTTRVMGTFGYVAPEYANTGLLNERSDVYSFGVLLMEVVTGRDPVDYSRPPSEVNLVDWLKLMVGQRRSEEVADPNLDPKPTSRALKRALLIALRCVDPDSVKRPKMGHVVHMLEADEFPYRDDRRTTKAGRPPDPQKVQRPVESGFADSKRGTSRYGS